MRLITGADIVDFYTARADLLILDTNGDFTAADYSDFPATITGDQPTQSGYPATTHDGDEVQILLERTSISNGDWFPDALTDDGTLVPEVADEMAELINVEGLAVMVAVHEAREAGITAEKAQAEADRTALIRAQAVKRASDLTSQSHVGRALGLNQSTVNKLVAKARRATVVTGTLTEADSIDILRTIADAGIDTSDLNAVISTTGEGFFTRKTKRGSHGNALTAEEGVAINEALVAAGWTTTAPGPTLTVLRRPA